MKKKKLFIGFTIGFGFYEPRKKVSPALTYRPNRQNFTLKSIASQLWKIKHWEIRLGTFEEIDNVEATWFIDPPYQFGGHAYKHSNKNIDFKILAEWCIDRKGQVIVCENTKATWMNFSPMVHQDVLTGKHEEAIWTNLKTVWNDNKQLSLI